MALLIAGIVFLLAGLTGIALGIPVKEFSFGNTEILAGVIVACTGAIMLSLWVTIRELKTLARRAASAVVAPIPRPPFSLPSALTDPSPYEGGLEDNGLLRDLDEVEPEPEPPAPSRPWQEETAPRGRRGETPLPEEELPATPSTVKPRRNLMFSSTTRRERERAEERPNEPQIEDLKPAIAAPPPLLPFKTAEPPANFENAWSPPDRVRTPDPLPRRAGNRPPFATVERAALPTRKETITEMPAEDVDDDAPQVTILKSGVVDGMAYSLYSDGSIEAQMPEGMMRFASIDELRAHLDQRGG